MTSTATLLAVLGLGLALNCGPVHGENGGRIVVSATILATNKCHFTSADLPAGSAATRPFECTGPGSIKTRHVRVRVPGTAANGAPGKDARTVLLILEP